MREILFRGKRVDNGEWVYGDLLQEPFGDFIQSIYEVEEGNLFFKKYRHKYRIVPETVGQYTGLTDKNGTKIFEGDIVKDDWGKVYEVFYTLDSCSFMVRCSNPPNEYEKGNYRLGKAWCETIRVIGNIHDNKELLGVE